MVILHCKQGYCHVKKELIVMMMLVLQIAITFSSNKSYLSDSVITKHMTCLESWLLLNY